MSTAEQMIADAGAAITASPTASTSRTLFDAVRAGEPDNYITAWFRDLDLLTLSVPRPGEPCRFRLIVSPGAGRWNSATYMVGQADDALWRAERLPDGSFQLIPAGGSAAAEIADLIRRTKYNPDTKGEQE